MIPGTPKDLLCYFAGLTDIKPLPFLLICSLGRLPSLVTSTVGGDALGTESYVLAAVVFAVTLLISGAGLLCYRWLCRRHNRAHDQQEAEKGRPSGGKVNSHRRRRGFSPPEFVWPKGLGVWYNVKIQHRRAPPPGGRSLWIIHWKKSWPGCRNRAVMSAASTTPW